MTNSQKREREKVTQVMLTERVIKNDFTHTSNDHTSHLTVKLCAALCVCLHASAPSLSQFVHVCEISELVAIIEKESSGYIYI